MIDLPIAVLDCSRTFYVCYIIGSAVKKLIITKSSPTNSTCRAYQCIVLRTNKTYLSFSIRREYRLFFLLEIV